MQKLRIKNFGPIKDGFSDGFFDINKCTIFIGEQGSGKSTIAKIYSTFTWLEKDIYRNDGCVRDFRIEEFKNICKNQRIDDYFTNETELEYSGNICYFYVSNSEFRVEVKSGAFLQPKIMYIPSERNLLTILENADRIQRLPVMLRLLQKEYQNALIASEGEVINLPLDGFKLKFDKKSRNTYIVQENTVLNIQNASSGLQSAVPISIVVNFLFSEINKPLLDYMTDFSNFDIDRIKEKLRELVDRELYNHLIDVLEKDYAYGNIKNIDSSDKLYIEMALKSFINLCLITIVEEPEQNLFPVSQVKILEELIRIVNAKEGNGIFITTHSPYILSALNNYIYASEIFSKTGRNIEEINKDLFLPVNNVSAYKIESGKIIDIVNSDYNMIDTTEIDDCSSMVNAIYDKLVELDE